MHFLVHCSNFCEPLKNSESCPSNQVSMAAMTSMSEKKMAIFQLFFSVQGTGGSPMGLDPENRVGD